MALALYRKYRPRTFAEVIGQEHVTEPLSQALRSGRLHHAYLFSGPRGCGKTSSARILARSLNCEQGPTPEPCGVCASCRSLTNDGPGSIDVIEIDAASHGGVDDARDLREKAFFAPASSRYKIYVIDEAHMVSSAGFNALLKLVEEPPDYVKFIFATTEPEKVLGTIRSRTHHYPFRLIPPAVLRPYLQQLTEAEGIHVEPAVFPLVVRAGGGSARDTLSVLDQLIAGAGPDGVSYPRAVALLGVTDVTLIDEMCDALAAGDGAAAYSTIDRVAEAGHDPRRFASDLLERLRDLIVLQQVPDAVTKGLIDGPADQLEAMSAQATRLGPATLSRCADIVHNGLVEMRGTTAPRLLLELITARMLLPGAEDSTGSLLQRLERMERRLTLAGDPPAVRGETEPVAGSGHHPAPAQPVTSPPLQAPASSAGGGLSAARAAAAAAGKRAAPARPGPSSSGPADAAAPAGEPVGGPAGSAPAREGLPAAQAGGAPAGGAQAGGAPAGGAPAGGAPAGSVQTPGPPSGGDSAQGSAGSSRSSGAGSPAGRTSGSGAHASGALEPSSHDDEPPWDDEPYPADDWDAAEPAAPRGRAADSRAPGMPTQSRSEAAPFAADSSGAAAGFGPDRSAGGAGSISGGGRSPSPDLGAARPAGPDSPAGRSAGPEGPDFAARRPAGPEGSDFAAGPPAGTGAAGGGVRAERRGEPAGVLPDAPEEPGAAAVAGAPGQLTAAAVREVWPEIVAAIGRKSKKVSALAAGATVRDLDGQTVILTFRYPAHAKMVAPEAPLIASALYEALGGQWQIRCEVAGEAGGAAQGPPAQAVPRRSGPATGRESTADRPAQAVGAQQAQAASARAPQSRRQETEASSSGGDDDWPEPARPGGLSGTAAQAEATVPAGDDWPEVSPIGTAGLRDGQGSASGDDATGPARPAGRASSDGVGHGAAGFAAGPGAADAGSASGEGTYGRGNSAGGSDAAADGAGPTSANPAGSISTAAVGEDDSRASGAPVRDARSGSPLGGSSGVSNGATGQDANGAAGGVAAGAGLGSGTSAGSGAAGSAGAAGGDSPRTGRNAAPGSGLAAARAAAAGARNAAATRQAAKPAASSTPWSDGSPAEEAPYDPEYDGPPPGGVASFEGFDPGDEPTDDVIDEKTARESSEQQAMRLLRDAFGAEKIGES